MIASCLDQASVVETILALPDVDVNVADVVHPSGFVSNVFQTCFKQDGKTALLLAVAKAATNVLPLLLAHPSLDVNQTDNNGSSALLVACATGRGDVLRLLLAHPTIDLNLASTVDTSTVVLAAALNGAADMLAILVQDKRADVNVVDKLGNTALIAASHTNRPDVVRVLLSRTDVDLSVQNLGKTALDIATSNYFQDVVDLLVAHR
ncbi:hypothetical protein DYB37_004392 [Aphanomyces astaci]|uniref:Uncharacterized protein n=3 Tax=Aphanomyces astaci TaxID=112090 RepID=A0A397C8V6_APHAT|nr:hypothetical protein DYB38_009686 [Aphanomyces astaci]RHY93930.1 hypothetical protein DYB35_002353 [Aphanomyces astaci]RHZ06855.1 hypothetical protein DYB31_008821 [Aphanomyces astaci]RHZ14219.1 hypothetical protein DYB37_004392 [Aphanomyces astaci]RQM25453.1 hypothetical protein B5M09_007007 [Aphanomyces astaci]